MLEEMVMPASQATTPNRQSGLVVGIKPSVENPVTANHNSTTLNKSALENVNDPLLRSGFQFAT